MVKTSSIQSGAPRIPTSTCRKEAIQISSADFATNTKFGSDCFRQRKGLPMFAEQQKFLIMFSSSPLRQISGLPGEPIPANCNALR